MTRALGAAFPNWALLACSNVKCLNYFLTTCQKCAIGNFNQQKRTREVSFRWRFLEEKLPNYYSGYCSLVFTRTSNRHPTKILQFSIGVPGRRPPWIEENKAWKRNILHKRIQKIKNPNHKIPKMLIIFSPKASTKNFTDTPWYTLSHTDSAELCPSQIVCLYFRRQKTKV